MSDFTKNNTIVIGDSHSFHIFENLFNVIYLRDITLNKFRQLDRPKYSFYEDKISYNTYFLDDEKGEDIFKITENYENVIFSIGEIDVRFFLHKYPNYVEKIDELVGILSTYLHNFDNNIYLLNVIPPSSKSNNSHIRKDITNTLNNKFKSSISINFIEFNEQIRDSETYLNTNYTSDGIHLNEYGNNLVQKIILGL